MSEVLAQLEKKGGGGGDIGFSCDFTCNYYYGVVCPQTFYVENYKTVTVKNRSSYQLRCYGDGVVLATIQGLQTSTFDITNISAFKVQSVSDGYQTVGTATFS